MTNDTLDIPDHSVIAVLGKGGMATVYLARDESLRRQVALKVLDATLGDQDPSFVKRFVREAQTAASLTHPHIVPVFQYGETDDGRHWLTMAFLDGGSLKDRLDRGPIDAEEAIGVTRQIAEALVPAHARNIVHRDLKPDNILFQGESASLTDFGIAKLLDATTQLTERGSPGTVRYMSPEQAWGEPVDQRSDLYSLGVVLYEMLTCRIPTSGDSLRAIVANIAHEPPAPLAGELAGLQPLLSLMLAKDPADRLESSAELVRVLTAIQRNIMAGMDLTHVTDGVSMAASGAPAATEDQDTALNGLADEGVPVAVKAPTARAAAAAQVATTAGQRPAQAAHQPPPVSGEVVEATEILDDQPAGRRRGLLAGVLLALVAAAGGGWWLSDQAVTLHASGPKVGDMFRDRLRAGGEGPQMVVVPAGSFRMGSNDGYPDERPVHTVNIGNPFAVGVYEVTFDDYDRFARAANRALPKDEGWGRGQRPVINVSWEDATAYVEWLAAQAGARYRLPTEAEWEYVARGGSTSRWWFGDREGDLCRHANIPDRTARAQRSNWATADCDDGNYRAAPVGGYTSNGYGLYDVHGNVWEWVQDCFSPDYSSASVDGSAADARACEARVLRGGGWADAASSTRSANRGRRAPGFRTVYLGLRVARTL